MDELTPAQQTELADRLEALDEQLRAALQRGTEGGKPVLLDQQSVGRLSRVDALQQQAIAKNSLENIERRLSRVRVALSAVAQGNYGFCRSCEEPVGYKRLRAQPEAPLCVACQAGGES